MPTAPLHQGCSASQAITSSASSCSCGRYSSSRMPSESPVPRRSTRTPAYPWPAKYGWWYESRFAKASPLRYGRYSRIAGTGSSSASSGSQMRAASRVPSDIGIQVWSMRLTERGNSVRAPTAVRVYVHEHPADLHERRARGRDGRGVRGQAGGGARRSERAAPAPDRRRGRLRRRALQPLRPGGARAPWRAAPTTPPRARVPSPSQAARVGGPRLGGDALRRALRAHARGRGGIGERHLELAAVASLETGKNRTESILEVQEAVDLITTYADLMEQNEGYAMPLQSFVEGERNTDVLLPYGVFAVIVAVQLPGRAGGRHAERGADRRQHGGAEALRGGALVGRDPRRRRTRCRARRRAS